MLRIFSVKCCTFFNNRKYLYLCLQFFIIHVIINITSLFCIRKEVFMADRRKVAISVMKKKERLQALLDRPTPLGYSQQIARDRRDENSRIFLAELDYVLEFLRYGIDFIIVSRSRLKDMTKIYDICTVDFDGKFCKVVKFEDIALPPKWVIWIAPCKEVSKP